MSAKDTRCIIHHPYVVAKMCLFSFFLAPLRLLGIFGVGFLFIVGFEIISRVNTSKRVMDVFCRIMSHLFLFCASIVVRTKGTPDPRARLWTSTHQHVADGFAIVAAGGPTRVLAKKQAGNIPILGYAARKWNAIFVDRRSPESRAEAMKKMKEAVTSTGEDAPLLVYPEGTTSFGDEVLGFHKGVFGLGRIWVQPIVVSYPYRYMNTCLGYVDNPRPAFCNLWLLMCQVVTPCTVEFLEPVFLDMDTAEENADKVRNHIITCTGRTDNNTLFKAPKNE